MKREVAFFKDKRNGFSAKNILALYRSLGYTDEQIKNEMEKLKAKMTNGNGSKPEQVPVHEEGE